MAATMQVLAFKRRYTCSSPGGEFYVSKRQLDLLSGVAPTLKWHLRLLVDVARVTNLEVVAHTQDAEDAQPEQMQHP